jgi:DNA polymerase III delta subunit
MIIFYYGTDAYRITQAVSDAITGYRTKYPGGLNLFRIDMTEGDAMTHLKDTLRNASLFSDIKLVHCTHAFDKKADSGELYSFIKSQELGTAKDVVMCISAMESKQELLKIDKGLFTYLEKHAKPLKEFVLPVAMAEQNIFALIDAIASRNRALAIQLLTTEMAKGRDAYYILSMITFQFRNLLSVKDLMVRKLPPTELAQKSGLAPFILRKSQAQAQKFTLVELTAAFSRLAELDTAAKQGMAHLEDEVMNLVLKLA